MSNFGKIQSLPEGSAITNPLPPDIQVPTTMPSPVMNERSFTYSLAHRSLVDEPTSDTTCNSPTGQADRVALNSTTGSGTVPRSAPLAHIAGLNKWSGRIVEVDDDTFTAELSPLNHQGPVVLADFKLSDLDADENEPIEPGDLFYLAVRTVRERGRRVSRTSTLLLRRLGKWSADEIIASYEAAKAEQQSLRDYIG